MRYVELQGEAVPALGFGTWRLKGEVCERAVSHAIGLGYRHIDTARMYDNEPEVGRGIRAGGVDRDDIFLTTKIWPQDFQRKRLLKAAEDSLRSLQVERVDLLLLHWPNPEVPLAESVGAMLELKEAGKVRHVGVSNFPPGMVREAAEIAPIFCNQVEYHPYLSQKDLVRQASEMGYMLTAYCPLARGRTVEEPVLQRIGEAHGKTSAQVALRWLIQQPNVAAIPKSADEARRAANLDIFDFELSDEEMRRIDALNGDEYIVDPATSYTR